MPGSIRVHVLVSFSTPGRSTAIRIGANDGINVQTLVTKYVEFHKGSLSDMV